MIYSEIDVENPPPILASKKLQASCYARPFWRYWLLYPKRTHYNIYTAYTYQGNLNPQRLEAALQAIVNNNYNLRSTFSEDGGKLIQTITEPAAVILQKFDAKNLEAKTHIAETLASEPYDLKQGPLYRFAIIQNQEDQTTTLVLAFHHIIIDAFQYQVLIRQLEQFYQQPDQSHDMDSLKKVERHLQNEQIRIQKSDVGYWAQLLQGAPLDTVLPHQKHQHTQQQSAVIAFQLPDKAFKQLSHFSKQHHTSVFNLLKITWATLMSLYCQQDKLIITYPISMRKKQEKELKGAWVNALFYVFEAQGTFLDAIKRNKADKGSIKNRHTPTEDILKALGRQDNIQPHTLFKIAIAETELRKQAPRLEPNLIATHETSYNLATSELLLEYQEVSGTLHFQIDYLAQQLSPNFIQRLGQNFISLLEHLLAYPDQPLTANCYPLPSELSTLKKWNQKEKAYRSQPIHQSIEAQVNKTPKATAAIFKNQTIAYAELNKRANQLARLIRQQYQNIHKRNLKPDTFIAICMPRSLDMLIGLLAILKAGAAYVPINPDCPVQRARFILKDTGATLILSHSTLTTQLQSFLEKSKGTPTILVDQYSTYAQQPSHNLKLSHHAKQLAYVIYTSGTTGQPKGVMVEHRNVANLCSMTKKKLQHNSVCGQQANIFFDISIAMLFSALSIGAKLVIFSKEDQFDPKRQLKLIRQHQITDIFIPTALLKQFGDFKALDASHLQHLYTGGESLEGLRKLPTRVQLFNLYGPTETTAYVTCGQIHSLKNIHLGFPIQNTKIYIVDSRMRPLPIGVTGEVLISGDNLARGYLNRPECTQTQFVSNPFVNDKKSPYARVYKTGDLAHWQEDGSIAYVGRNDDQVKIRGFRIECHAITAVLEQHPAIQQALIIAKTRNNGKPKPTNSQYLVAYYQSHEPLSDNDLINHLSQKLPSYMIPTAFVNIQSWPLTSNGKIDQKSLPKPQRHQSSPPTTPTETTLCSIWQKVLNLPRVGLHDDFFRIGGDSILSLQLVSAMKQHGIHCDIKAIFTCRTICKLAQYLDKKTTEVEIDAEQGTLSGNIDLLPIQQWFFMQNFQNLDYFNQSFMVKVPPLDISRLENILPQLAEHHDMLRTHFKREGSGHYQQYYQTPFTPPPIKTLNIKNTSASEVNKTLTNWQMHFDIEKGSLWQIGYLEGYADGSSRLYIACHHLLIDAVSWRILIEDLKALYQQNSLRDKTSSYRQWTKAIQSYAHDHIDEIPFWQKQLHANTPFHTNQIQPQLIDEEINFSKAVTRNLLQIANKAYQTQINDLLLTALAQALHKLQGTAKTAITFESHGRELIDENIDISRTVGWFTALYPISLTATGDLSTAIKAVRSQLRQIPNKGIGYGALAYCQPQSKLDLKLPPIAFNYLGQFDQEEADWQITQENSGQYTDAKNKGSYLLNINGKVMNGQLSFHIQSYLTAALTQAFTKNFQENLTAIIKHCSTQAKQQVTEKTASYQPYLILNNTRQATKTLLVFPPAEGGAESYINSFCPHIHSDTRIILIDNYEYKHNAFPAGVDSHASLAEYYCQLIEDLPILKEGPIWVSGYSFGAITALEATKKLVQQNRQVEALFLWDPPVYQAFEPPYISNIKPHEPGWQADQWHLAYQLKAMPHLKKVVLFQAKFAEPSLPVTAHMVKTQDLGLKLIFPNLKTQQLECSHLEMLKEPYISQIAKQVQQL